MKKPKEKANKKGTAGIAEKNDSTSAHRDMETVELFTEILDRSCPRE